MKTYYPDSSSDKPQLKIAVGHVYMTRRGTIAVVTTALEDNDLYQYEVTHFLPNSKNNLELCTRLHTSSGSYYAEIHGKTDPLDLYRRLK